MMLRRLAAAALLVAAGAGAARAQDFSGSWDVSGQDPQLGGYAGWAQVRSVGAGYEVSRLVEASQLLPAGRTLVLSWRGTGTLENGGLRVRFDLRRQEFIATLGAFARGPQDRIPLAVSARLGPTSALPAGPAAAGTRLDGLYAAGAAQGPTETWTRVLKVLPPHPWLETRRDPAPPSALMRSACFALFRTSYHRLPWIAPYAARPEFQAATPFQVVETTGREYTRAHPDRLLVVQKVPDAIGLEEEDRRASAFRWKLREKATGFDGAMKTDHVEASTGMLGGVVVATGEHTVHGDSGLHQGVWVASQALRWDVTHDPDALANVERGTRALVLMCDAPGNPAEFARAVQDAATAPPSWARSTALPWIAYHTGGNNDMLHGVDLGFVQAERVLAPSHPLLADIGARAKRLVENVKVAGSGTHEIVLAGVAARLTGDAAMKKRYRKKVVWSPLELLWLASGEGIGFLPEFDGRSGAHLSTTTIVKMRLLGGARPDFFEQLWRNAADLGARRAFVRARVFRPGLLAAVAASAGAPGAADLAKDVLAEVPFPRPVGTGTVDTSIDPAFCVSPWPAMPYKRDYMTNQGRVQSLATWPIWTWPDSDNLWKEGPNTPWRGGLSSVRWSPQDVLFAYWYGRAFGAIGPAD